MELLFDISHVVRIDKVGNDFILYLAAPLSHEASPRHTDSPHLAHPPMPPPRRSSGLLSANGPSLVRVDG